ncbi:MAG: methyltransferase family protein [Promethearchaeota archaeon]|jgi:protein-S-isoprenylcysteine O-methyltransferase Ste14
MPHLHENRLGNEAPHSHLLQGGSLVIFALVWILDSLIFTFSIFLSFYIPFLFRIILFGIIIIIAIVFIQISQKILFNQPENKDELITEGIFGHVRHPLYLGVLLIYLSFIFLSISLISLVVWVIILLIYDRLATFEEKELEKIYKREYLEYKDKIPKWIPRFKNQT